MVDDGSTDASVEIARSYDAVTCLSRENQGQSVGRNTGIRAATGGYFVFLDHDDALPDGLLTYPEAFHVRLPVPPSLALFRGEIVRGIGGFDRRRQFAEDLDFFLRVLRNTRAIRSSLILRIPFARFS